jgi:hypothetical protein
MAIKIDSLPEPLRKWLGEQSLYFGQVDFASPYAVAFAKELWEAAQLHASESAMALAAPIDEVHVHPSLQTLYTVSGNSARALVASPVDIEQQRKEHLAEYGPKSLDRPCPYCGGEFCRGECPD